MSRLSIVRPPELEPDLRQLVADFHPRADESRIVASHSVYEDETQYSLRFGMNFDGDDVIEAVSQPLAPHIESFSEADVRRSLKSLTYPNSRVSRQATRLGGLAARDHLREIRPDVKGLVAAIDNQKPYDDMMADVHIFDKGQAMWHTYAALEKMGPTELASLIGRAGLAVDEMDVWRMKQGRKNVPLTDETLRAHMLDPTTLRIKLLQETFTMKHAIGGIGVTNALLLHDELPTGPWAERVEFIERVKRLPEVQRMTQKERDAAAERFGVEPDQRDEVEFLAERWRVILRRDGAPVHVVDPVIQWRAPHARLTDNVRSDMNYYDLQRSFIFGGAQVRYSPISHHVVHTSPSLGAGLVANAAGIDYKLPLDRLYQRNPHVIWNEQRYSSQNAGYQPLFLGRMGLSSLLETDQFRQIEKSIKKTPN